MEAFVKRGRVVEAVMIRRSERPDGHFTVIRNHVLRDSRLSYRARGVLCALLSRPDNWTVRSEQLAADAREGRDAVRGALRELREHGYISTEVRRMGDGTLVTEQVVYDEPVTNALLAPKTGNQATDNQPTVSQASLEVTTRTNEKKEQTHSATQSLEDGFNVFWLHYPRKVGKGQARKAFAKAVLKEQPQAIIDATIRYAMSRTGQDIRFTPYPASWLNGERWTDDPEHNTQVDADSKRFNEALARITQQTELQP